MPIRYVWPLAEMKAMYRAGKTCEEIAEAISVVDQFGREHVPTAGGVLKAMKNVGCKMRPTGAKGKRNGSWKGGRRVGSDGYVWVRCPTHPNATGGYVQEHRLVAERVLGRKLRQEEVVHHEDDDKQNNDPSNLVVYPDNATHMRETRKGKKPNWSKAGYARILKTLAACRKAQAAKRKPAESSGIRLG